MLSRDASTRKILRSEIDKVKRERLGLCPRCGNRLEFGGSQPCQGRCKAQQELGDFTRRWSEEEMLSIGKLVSADRDYLSCKAYNKQRDRRTMPTSHTIIRRFGSWPEFMRKVKSSR